MLIDTVQKVAPRRNNATVSRMTRLSALLLVGIVALVSQGISQSTEPPIRPAADVITTANVTVLGTTHINFTTSANVTVPSTSTHVNVTTSLNGTVSPNLHAPKGNSSVTKNSTPRIQDQTNQTYDKLENSTIAQSHLLDSVYDSSKADIAQTIQSLSKIDKTKIDTSSLATEINELSKMFGSLYNTTGGRLNTSLKTVGLTLNKSLAAFISLEQANIGKLKLSSDAKTVARELRQVESTYYGGVDTCLVTYNGSVTSDILTVRNMADTYLKNCAAFVDGVSKAGCPSAACTTLLKNTLGDLKEWRSAITTAFNKIPNTSDLGNCVTTSLNTAKTDLTRIAATAPGPISCKAIIANQTTSFQTNLDNMLKNFTNSNQKLSNVVTNRINTMRTVVSRNARDDPKTIINTSFKPIPTVDDTTAQLLKGVVPRLTADANRMIAPLLTKETAVEKLIQAALVKESLLSTDCDTALQNITTTKANFNQSMIACFNSSKASIEAILSATTGTINGTLVTFTGKIIAAEQFTCPAGTGCTAAAMETFGKGLRDSLSNVGAKLLTDLKTSVQEQANRVYVAFQACVDGSVKQALMDFNEQTNADIKKCLT